MRICEEKILLDVTKVEIYNRADVTISIPHNIAYSQSVEAQNGTGITFVVGNGKSPIITMELTWTDDVDAVMEQTPKAVVTEKREAIGLVRTHTIEGTLIDGTSEAMRASEKLAYCDSVAVLITYGGDKYLVNAFINAAELNVKDDESKTHTASVKYTAQSYSGFILIDSGNGNNNSGNNQDGE